MEEFKMKEQSLEELKKITGGGLENQDKGEYEKLAQECMEKFMHLTPEEKEKIGELLKERLKTGN